MATIHLTDILKIFNDFEPSRLKLWEIVRTYNYVDFAKFIYLLENVTTAKKRTHITIDHIALYGERIAELLHKQASHIESLESMLDNSTDAISPTQSMIEALLTNGLEHTDFELPTTTAFSNLRVDRTDWQNLDIIWAKKTDAIVVAENDRYAMSSDAYSQIEMLQKYLPGSINISIDTLMTHIRLKKIDETNLLERIVTHNIGTQHYFNFLTMMQYLLFPANQQASRNESNATELSGVTQFINFYKMIHNQQIDDIDPRGCRSLVLPKPRRVFTRNLNEIYADTMATNGGHLPNNIIVQPLYQGLHVIVYAAPNETRCYSSTGELCTGIAYALRCKVNCTFQAIVLPLDALGNVRSWRYWNYRTSFIMYVVDVLRYEQLILTSRPQKVRLRYVDRIVEDNPQILKIPKDHSSWLAIEERYNKHRDIYDPIVGVMLRDGDSVIDGTLKNKPIEFRFNILYTFDLYTNRVVEVSKVLNEIDAFNKSKTLSELTSNDKSELISHDYNLGRLFLNFEMADYKTICLAYGNCDTYIYLFRYNRNIHQFMHAGKLKRLPYEYNKLSYQRTELIYVLNCRIRPMGVMYLRVYYNQSRQVIAYETKPMDSRYKVPYTNVLYPQPI